MLELWVWDLFDFLLRQKIQIQREQRTDGNHGIHPIYFFVVEPSFTVVECIESMFIRIENMPGCMWIPLTEPEQR